MLHLDGFEQYGAETKLLQALTRADYVASGQWTSVAGRGRFSRALSGKGTTLGRTVAWPGDKFSIGFTCSFTARGSMAWITAGGQQMTFWMNPDTGLPNMNDVIGGALPTKERYYFYELELDRDTGEISLFINNKLDSKFTMPAAMRDATAMSVQLGWREPSEYRAGVTIKDDSVKTFDDFYLRDGARLGPIVITTRFPESDVDVEWFKAGTGTTHAATVGSLPPDPLDNYLAADEIGKEDRFKSTQAMTNNNAVVATGLVVLARKSPTLDAKLGVFMGGQSGAPLRSDERVVDSAWKTQFICFERIGGDTPNGIVGSEFGINVSNA